MAIPPHLPQMHYGYEDGFTTIFLSLIGSCIGCLFLLFISFL